MQPLVHEMIRFADLGTAIIMDAGAVISAKPLQTRAYNELLLLTR